MQDSKSPSGILRESLLTLKQAAAAVPPYRGRKTHVSTIFRWIVHGIGGVRLEAARYGARWVTSREALERFAQRLTEARTGQASETRPRTGRHQDQVERELNRAGIN